MSQLTPKQQQIYDYILTFADEHGYPPSVREIAEAVDLKSPSTAGGGKDPGHHHQQRPGPWPEGPGARGGQCGGRLPHSGGGVH